MYTVFMLQTFCLLFFWNIKENMCQLSLPSSVPFFPGSVDIEMYNVLHIDMET